MQICCLSWFTQKWSAPDHVHIVSSPSRQRAYISIKSLCNNNTTGLPVQTIAVFVPTSKNQPGGPGNEVDQHTANRIILRKYNTRDHEALISSINEGKNMDNEVFYLNAVN